CLWVSVTQTQLFFLQQPADVSTSEQSSLLARSYGSGGKSDLDLLWKLHVRHGHRNFVDVARQYNLTMPSEIPAVHLVYYGHLSSGFERATRRAEGFHSDFRGPFS